MRLAEPAWLILLFLVPLSWLLVRFRPRLAWPAAGSLGSLRPSGLRALRDVPIALRALAVGCLVVALARPQTVGGHTRIAAHGVSIVVALDHSSSMNATDFQHSGESLSRLEAAKRTFATFVEGRPEDLIGLVVFANYPDLACPPTLDHAFLLEAAQRVRPARAGDDGTNLGDAVAWSLDALRHTSSRKKVLVLLTDGRNQPAVPHPLDPEQSARLARDLGVTLHTIAVGQAGGQMRRPEPTTGLDRISQVESPDFALLTRMAELGGGRAFVAADARDLEEVFHTIDQLEKSLVEGTIQTRYDERFGLWVLLAAALLVVDRLLCVGRLRRLP